jgi:AcrR family transcriptional regulator
MKTQKTDRRSVRTRRLLGEALIALLLEKRYDDITVQDILERANIGRSTFYEHYWDKEDLLTSEIERVIDVLDQRLATPSQHAADFLPSLALFQHVQEQQRLFQALLRGQGIRQALKRGQGLHVVTQAFQDLLCTRVEQRLREQRMMDMPDKLFVVLASYIAGAFMTLMQWWLETDLAWSPERMDALFRDLVLPGVDHLLNQALQAAPDNGAEHIKSRASPLSH